MLLCGTVCRKNASAASHSVLTPSVNPSPAFSLLRLSSNSHAAHQIGACTHKEAYYSMLQEREGVVLTEGPRLAREFFFPFTDQLLSKKSLQDTRRHAVFSPSYCTLLIMDWQRPWISPSCARKTFTGRDSLILPDTPSDVEAAHSLYKMIMQHLFCLPLSKNPSGCKCFHQSTLICYSTFSKSKKKKKVKYSSDRMSNVTLKFCCD